MRFSFFFSPLLKLRGVVFAQEYLRVTLIPDLSLPITFLTKVKGGQEREKLRNTWTFLSETRRCCSVDGAAWLKGPFGGSTKNFNVVLCPGEDVSDRRFAVTGRQVGNFSH